MPLSLKPVAPAGRPTNGTVYQNFVVGSIATGGHHFQCKHCNSSWKYGSKPTTKLAVHLIKCKECPRNVKVLAAKSSNAAIVVDAARKAGLVGAPVPIATVQASATNPDSPSTLGNSSFASSSSNVAAGTRAAAGASEPSDSSSLPSTKKRKVDTTIQRYSDFCDSARADHINMCWMSMIAGCALPFILVESVFFVRFVRSLNTTYADRFLPKADAFINTWLPKLFQATKAEVEQMWKDRRGSYRTLGTDGFTNEQSGKVTIVTESIGDKVAFKNCIPQGEHTADTDYTFGIWLSELRASVPGDDDSQIETMWCSVVADNTAVNPAAGKQLQRAFPKIFFNGCRTHCADLLVEDIAGLSEVELFMEDCLLVVKFVCTHAKVKEAHLRLTKEKGGTMLKLFPSTRFAYAAMTLDSLLGTDDKNWEALQAVVHEDDFWKEGGTCSSISEQAQESFRSLVQDRDFFKRLKAIHSLFSILSAFVHHQETPGTRASFVLPLFTALQKDISIWVNKKGVDSELSSRTLDAIKRKVADRWAGTNEATGRNICGLYSEAYLMATVVDPMFTPASADLSGNWDSECAKVIKRFYPTTGNNSNPAGNAAAKAELDKLAMREGNFGRLADECQADLRGITGPPPNNITIGHLAHEIKRQKAALTYRSPATMWSLHFGSQFPKLFDIALRLLQMGTQSADVERVCKANKIVHSKVRNRLTDVHVNNLLCCYVNLRLLKKCPVNKSLDQDGDMEGFLGQAILAHCGKH